MKRQILTLVVVLAVFVGGLLLGRYLEQKSQNVLCEARIAEAKQHEHSVCETQLNHDADSLSHLTDAYIRLQKQCLGQ